MSIELSWELIQAALQVFGYIGVTTIAISAISSYRRRKLEFQKIRNVLIVELEENVFAAKGGLSSALSHTLPIPLLSDDGWRIILSSDQVCKFVIPRADDPLRQLSDIYGRVRLVNQMILLRQSMVFSVIRTSRRYDEILGKVDSFLIKHLKEIIPAMKRAKENLSQKDFKQAFMKNPVYAEYAKVAQEREKTTKND